MKFGGTSVATAEAMLQVAALVKKALLHHRVLVVASAAAGVTNLLLDLARRAEAGGDAGALADEFRARHREISTGLARLLQRDLPNLDGTLDRLGEELHKLLQGMALLRDVPPTALAHLSALGERAACACLQAALTHTGHAPQQLDPIQLLPCHGVPLEATPDAGEIRKRFAAFREGPPDGEPPRLGLMPGFFGGDGHGKTVLLGRGGSDWSAALAAAAVDADLLEIWTDVDGIYSADPRVVPEAHALAEISFEEAMELAHFGAKVLHPKTIAPARERGIAVRVCDTFRPERPGTWILPTVAPPEQPVRGISLLPEVALVEVAGPGMPGVPGVAARIFAALAAKEISVILITQASSECTLTLAVRMADADAALQALNQAFDSELAGDRVDPIGLQPDLAILSIVGEGMRTRVGVAGTFLSALGQVGVSAVAIAQGSSERSISVVIAARDGAKAMRHVHHRFLGTREVLELYLCGVGTVGRQFLVQLAKQQKTLQEGPPAVAAGVELRLCGVLDSKHRVLGADGLDPLTARDQLAAATLPADLQALLDDLQERRPGQAVLVDCTSSAGLAEQYPRLLAGGLHIVTASKHANSAPLGLYRSIRQAAQRHRRRFHYETNVGAGLPVIDTLRNLLAGGDRVERFDGLLSGSMSFLFGLLQEGTPLSAAVRQARELGFTEPDPRDDLSGLDVARKVLILAREAGLELELSDVQVQGVLPAEFDATGSVEEFLVHLEQLDAQFSAWVEELRMQGQVARQVATFGHGECRVGVQAVGPEHPLAAVRGGENAFSFLTVHYHPRPLVVRGYGAGAQVTAAGVLADVLKVARES